jgi:flagellar motor component MotA
MFGGVFIIVMNKEEVLNIINEIEENITICCNASMDSDDVLDLIDKLKELIRDEKKEGGSNLENS